MAGKFVYLPSKTTWHYQQKVDTWLFCDPAILLRGVCITEVFEYI